MMLYTAQENAAAMLRVSPNRGLLAVSVSDDDELNMTQAAPMNATKLPNTMPRPGFSDL